MEQDSEYNPSLITGRQAGRVVAALNYAAAVEGTGREKVRALLTQLQDLLGYDVDMETLMYDQLDRDPAPRVAERVWAGPTFDKVEPRTPEQVQETVDAGAGMWWQLREQVQKRSPRPSVVVYSQDSQDQSWFEFMRKKYLEPVGWSDILSSVWLDKHDRLVQFVIVSKIGDPAFNDRDRELIQLIVCAVAPLINREMFRDAKREVFEGLSERQTDVIRHLLIGMSEKEIAKALHRSTETIHNHVRAIYQQFNVNSRGELMAQFVDRRVLEAV